jgi:hypothetical protein
MGPAYSSVRGDIFRLHAGRFGIGKCWDPDKKLIHRSERWLHWESGVASIMIGDHVFALSIGGWG